MYRANPRDGVAWVTGASSGIGRGVSLELARRGYRVVATARRAEELAALAQEARGAGGEIFPLPGDVTDRAGVDRLAADIEAGYGAITLAFLNAGSFFRDEPDEPCGDNFHRTLDLNLGGVVNCLAPVLRRMAERKQGQIAVNASVAGYGGLPGAASYCASKAAVIAMCESLHIDYASRGINLQVVCPGFVRTPLVDKGEYPTPFMIELDDACARICNGFERGGFEIAFPKRMVWLLKTLNLLPRPVYLWMMRQVT